MSMTQRRYATFVALVAGLALLGTGCGGDDSGDETTQETAEATTSADDADDSAGETEDDAGDDAAGDSGASVPDGTDALASLVNAATT
jgi:hypothetical protein